MQDVFLNIQYINQLVANAQKLMSFDCIVTKQKQKVIKNQQVTRINTKISLRRDEDIDEIITPFHSLYVISIFT